MTVRKLIEESGFLLLNEGRDTDREIGPVFCCDLLSVAMSRAPKDCAWVTVMGNMNTLAVASLADASLVVMAEGATLDQVAMKKAKEQEITVLKSEEPVFETALKIHGMIHA